MRESVQRRRFLHGAAAAAVALPVLTRAPHADAQAATATGGALYTNVRDHGATGDGTTDDTAAIQSAIAATADSGGGVVFLPVGTYAITGITLAAGVDLLGETRSGVILKFTPDSGDAVLVPALSFSRLSNFQVQSGATSGAAIHLQKSFTIDVDGVYVSGGYDGIFVEESTAIFITDFNLYNLSNSGVRITGPGGNDTYLSGGIMNLGQSETGACLLIEDYVNGAVNLTDADLLAGKYSLRVINSHYLRFENAYFDSSAEGAVLESGHLITFANCWFSNRPGNGLTIGAARGVTVLGGHVVNCGAHGIAIRDQARYVSLNGVQIVGNNDTDVAAEGISVDGTGIDYLSITGCAIGNDAEVAVGQTVGQEIGIHLTQRVRDSHYTISNNTLFGNNRGGILDEGHGQKYLEGNVGDEPAT